MSLKESISYKEVYLKAFSLSSSEILKSVVSKVFTFRMRDFHITVPSASIGHVFLRVQSRLFCKLMLQKGSIQS